MNSWDLVRQSFGVLGRDKRFLAFPILSTLAAAAVSAPFVLALFFNGAPVRWDAWHWLSIFLWYCCANFAIIFFNCALAASAQKFFDGGEPSLGQGIGEAAGRASAILMWAVVSSTVGVFLRWIDERSGLLGRIVVALVGMGWNMATYLIVPVLAIENRTAIESIRRAGELLRDTFGKQIISGFVFLWYGLLCALPGIMLGALAMNGFPPLIAVVVLYFVALAAAFSAARQIFAVALYRYATTGQVPSGYTGEGLRGAFRGR